MLDFSSGIGHRQVIKFAILPNMVLLKEVNKLFIAWFDKSKFTTLLNSSLYVLVLLTLVAMFQTNGLCNDLTGFTPRVILILTFMTLLFLRIVLISFVQILNLISEGKVPSVLVIFLQTTAFIIVVGWLIFKILTPLMTCPVF